MNKFSKSIFALGSSFFCLNTVYSGTSNSNNTTFLGPMLRGGYTSTWDNATAYSGAAEIGIKNFRLGGTVGRKIDGNQRFKVSIEYLWQNINYSFLTGNLNQWVSQVAAGGDYEYNFYDVDYMPQVDVSAYYSYAPDKSLGTRTGMFTTQGFTKTFVDKRNIAGSYAWGGAPGVSLYFWPGAKAGVQINYDNVTYNTRNGSIGAKGFGGTLALTQMVTDNIGIATSVGIRQPFNNYQVSVDWVNVPFFGSWELGLDGAYTAGKTTLPNTWNIGLSANYFLDQRCYTYPSQSEYAGRKQNDKGDYKGEATTRPVGDDFLAWTADPAVYMPQVLAISDEVVTATCSPGGFPLFIAPFPNVEFATLTNSIPAAPHFSGKNLVFSVAVNTKPRIGNSITINSSTGLITARGIRQAIKVTVSARNTCGTVSSNQFTIVFS